MNKGYYHKNSTGHYCSAGVCVGMAHHQRYAYRHTDRDDLAAVSVDCLGYSNCDSDCDYRVRCQTNPKEMSVVTNGAVQ